MSSIRRLAERLSRRIVLRRRLPSKFGHLPVYVTPEAALGYWLRMSRVDPMLYRMAEELVKPGAVVWDIGANVGLFSFCAASLAGRSGFVLSVEPDVWLASLVGRSAGRLASKRFPCADVKVLCASVSDSNRISQLEISERERASNHLIEASGSTQTGGARHSQPTVCVTLDFLLDYFPAPSVLKIDVEAHEVGVLKGAEKLLKKARPTIWSEVLRENSEQVTTLLKTAGYDLYGAETEPHPRIERAWFHTLAVPS
jgi:FkbM family methyltransferase